MPSGRQRSGEASQQKRARGRPTGSAPYGQRDEEALARFADRAVRTPGLKLGPALRGLGYDSEAAIRRAQAKWRKNRARFLQEAQLRLDSNPPDDVLGLLCGLFSATRHLLEAPGAKALLRHISDSMRQAQRRERARDILGLEAIAPFDVTDPASVETAISSFEAGIQRLGSEELNGRLGTRTLRELTPSMRLYLVAVMVHEMSLDMRREETQQTEPSLDAATQPGFTTPGPGGSK